MPPTQYPLSSKVALPPNSRDALPSLQQGADPLGWGHPKGPKGTPGCPRVPKGAFGALGGDGPTGPLGGYTEAIPNGTPFRLDGYYETTPKLKPWLESRLKGTFRRSRWPWVRNNAQMVHGQHWARNNQTICTKTDHLVTYAAVYLK